MAVILSNNIAYQNELRYKLKISTHRASFIIKHCCKISIILGKATMNI